jgi:hypothetical protein
MRNLIEVGGRSYDIVPKAIVRFLVEESTQLLRPKMIEVIFNSANLLDLLHEDPAVKKQNCRKAKDILNKFGSSKSDE